MTDRELMQMALDALRDARDYLDMVNTQAAEAKSRRLTKTLEALRTALEQPEQKPVAWIYDFPNPDNPADVVRDWTAFSLNDVKRDNGINVRPLYLAPPKSEWQGLTDEEINTIAATPAAIPGSYVHSFARAIEAKLKEKNL